MGLGGLVVKTLLGRRRAEFRFELGEFILVLGFEARGSAESFGLAVVTVFLPAEQFFINAAEEGDAGLEFGDVAIGSLNVSGLMEEQLR